MMWENDALTQCLMQMAKDDLIHREPNVYEYKNFWSQSTRDVALQLHKDIDKPDEGIALVIGKPDDDCPKLNFVDINDIKLSGDKGKNKNWLRAETKTFKHRKPAKIYFINNSILSEEDDSADWQNIHKILRYVKYRNK